MLLQKSMDLCNDIGWIQKVVVGDLLEVLLRVRQERIHGGIESRNETLGRKLWWNSGISILLGVGVQNQGSHLTSTQAHPPIRQATVDRSPSRKCS